MKKHFTAHFIFAATAMASQQACALGFGRVVSDAVLGETLSVTVPVHVEPGQRFGLDCVSVDVYYGESQLLPNAVRTQVDAGTSNTEWLVRISTTAPIAEPVVEVALSAGCEQRFSRRFTVFADPPLTAVAIAAPAPAQTQARSDARSGTASALAPVGAGTTAAGRVAAAQAAPRPHTTHRKGPTMALANELNAPSAPAAPRRGNVAAPDAGSARKPGLRAAAAVPAEAPRLVLDGGYAHLKLDIEEPIIPPAAAASGAAIALSDLDDPDAKRLRDLEQSIQAIKRSDEASRDQAAKLQAQLTEARSHDDWLPWVLGLLALAVAAVAALAWKLRQQARYAHSAWFNESQLNTKSPPMPVLPAVPADVVTAPVPVYADLPLPSVVEPLEHDTLDTASGGVVADNSATQPLDRSALAGMMAQDPSAPRELSVEELLDLEQQADFFIALGQEDAAVDLLMSHLRSAGGQSPLPYTKLLEIYRRQGDRSAYERTRARFNRRFNAYAPDWDTGPMAGRTLEDYPETVALVQTAWASPIDAMAVLEGLLFKRDDTSELFDLPAYRDVLVLYSLARDLWQQGGGLSGTHVDVLLPLDDTGHGGFLPQPPYPSAREVNDLDLTLDVYSTSTADDAASDFAPTRLASSVDFELPAGPDVLVDDHPANNGRDDGVHATLDTLSLSPVEATKPPPSPLDWEPGKPSPDDVPTKR